MMERRLEKTYEERKNADLVWLKVIKWDNIRTDPRFALFKFSRFGMHRRNHDRRML